MLTLGAGRGGRGGVGEAGTSGPPSSVGRHLSHDPGINIKKKISQWEGRSQLEGEQCCTSKGQWVPVSRTLSGGVHGNEACCNNKRCEPWAKACLAKAKSLGLDFREAQGRGTCRVNGMMGALDDVEDPNSVSQTTVCESVDPSNSTIAKDSEDIRGLANVKLADEDQCHSPPLGLDDPALMLPPGSFYISRGFWCKLEGSDVAQIGKSPPQPPVIETEHRDTHPATPPPKPQRTFQYKGAKTVPGRPHQAEKWTSCANQSQLSCQVSWCPPDCPRPPRPIFHGSSIPKHKNRKSFEFEDVVQFTGQGTVTDELQPSDIYHALSNDNVYEDIIQNSYEDVKLFPMCLPHGRPAQRDRCRTPQLPPKPSVLLASPEKMEKRSSQKKGPAGMATVTMSRSAPKPAAPKHRSRTQPLSQYVNKIQEIFNIKRGRKRLRSQGRNGYDSTVREETSGTDSDPEDDSTGRRRRCVHVQSTLRRSPRYSTLERDLICLQQQQLFQLFAVVSLRRSSPGNTYRPEITQQFPNKFEKSSRHSRETEDRLKAIPKFCFPDSQDWRPCGELPSETFSFVLTGEDGSRWFGYCRKILPSGKGKRLPEVHCIVSRLGCFNLFAKVLEEVERRREISPALVQPFMRSVMEAPFPAPGRTITVKSFLPGSGNEVLTLCRPVDSRLEHVHFQSLLQCLSVGHLLQVFASLLLERRVIFIADKLSTLSHCAHAALALLYPFTWQHTFVPVLPANMLDICCSPTPFLMGVLFSSLPQLLDLPIEEVLIVDLCMDKFVRQLGDEDCILPSKLQAALQHILEHRQQIMGQAEGASGSDEEQTLNSLISEAFVHFFVELVGHYKSHMSEAAGRARELQREAFRKSHPSRGARQFLQLFMETQMFAGFIQDRELRKGGVTGLFELRAVEHLNSNPQPEPTGVNRFIKGLGNKMKFLQKK
ncbi:DENN domain-containing protein 2C isoform X1 [Paramormyrops kingsleyae]|uniref:DENN domain-containing protein 2C isoform X1 n=1 Tax=Paramormyrops kingsleyae TaxID=1676925 RepID=UPI003B974B59